MSLLNSRWISAEERWLEGLLQAFPEGEALRDLARQIKAGTISELDRFLKQLSESVRGVGGEVHWAADADEARKIVVDLAEVSFLCPDVKQRLGIDAGDGLRNVHARLSTSRITSAASRR